MNGCAEAPPGIDCVIHLKREQQKKRERVFDYASFSDYVMPAWILNLISLSIYSQAATYTSFSLEPGFAVKQI